MAIFNKDMRDILSTDELKLLPRGYKRIGHVAIIFLPRGLANRTQEIARRIIDLSGAKTIAVREGDISGRYRVPMLRVVAGNPDTETIHRENGCRFKLDVRKVMFSTGNVHERNRVIELVSPWETVIDLFAGVGQFSIPIAVHALPRKVYAVELNPVAYKYLMENIRMNRVGHIVKPLLGDCSDVAPRGIADRVIMGILHLSHKYLPLAIQVIKPDGGVVHYHESVPSGLRFERPIKRILQAASCRKVEIINRRVVKRYAPGVDHVVVDAKIGPGI